MLLLLLAVTVIGLTHIRLLGDQLTAIVAERNQKSEYVVKLHGLNRSRYQSLRLATLIEDPFERDAELMRFSRMVLDFIRVRENFQAMPLDSDEFTSWHAVRAEVRTAENLADDIVELVQAERLDEAPARDGLEYEVEGQCSPVHASDGEIDGGVLVMRDVSEAREMQRKLHWQANHDSLTGLINRHLFEERVSRALTGQRRGQFPMSLLFIDLDHFKQVYDSAGHAAGDELLRQLAGGMQACMRESDILARLGGDEFGVLLLSCPDGMAEKIARDVREAVAGHLFVWQETSHRVGASIGVVHVPPLWNTLDACLAAADAACYKAKQGGRNDVVVHRH